jgi:hypothetical protein
MFVEYAVIDDYGDEAMTGHIVYRHKNLNKCVYWAENENFHSASIVKITDGIREQISKNEINIILEARTE